jgi:site-specific DNA recombinase
VDYDGYIRVSRVAGREGESFQSPAEQRRSIEGWAQSRGQRIDEWHEDFDVSGGTLERPGLDAVVARIKAGKTKGVVVAKLSRFSRAGVASALGLFQEIYDAGGEVVAVDVGIDPTTPVGKFARTIMLALNEMELDRYKEGWQAAKARAVRRGVFLGPTSLGFDKGPDGRFVPNADAPLVKRAFEVSGDEGLHAALAFCKATWPDRKWTATTARRLFANRLYKGDVVVGDLVGHIEPLVDEFTFDFAQHPAGPRRKAKDSYPLSGIAACAACGGTLVGQAARSGRSYRCNNSDCGGRVHVKAQPLEDLALAAIRSDPPKGGRTGEEVFQSAKAIIEARAEIERYLADTRAHALVGDELWRQGLRDRQEAYEAAQSANDEARKQRGELPDLDGPVRPIFERAIAEFTVRRGRESLPERVSLALAA